jgi:uncharacterized protein (TIGR02598 family)
MHTTAPPVHQTLSFPRTAASSLPKKNRRAGFSLIEVTLAIAIVAFAFIALIGLLPAGMNVFTQTMDSTNEMRIVSHLTSMMQATDYDRLNDPSFAGDIYYFDVDGGYLDSDRNQNARYANERIYAARVLFERQNVPLGGGVEYFNRDTVALKGMVFVGKNNETVKAYLSGVTNPTMAVQTLPEKHKVRIFPMVISKTDSIRQ